MSNLDWESCVTHIVSWGYNVMDKEYKSTKEILEIMCGVVGKGGNYLFNIDPKGDGSVPEETISLMRSVR